VGRINILLQKGDCNFKTNIQLKPQRTGAQNKPSVSLQEQQNPTLVNKKIKILPWLIRKSRRFVSTLN
jgi:hypothetical protein